MQGGSHHGETERKHREAMGSSQEFEIERGKRKTHQSDGKTNREKLIDTKTETL